MCVVRFLSIPYPIIFPPGRVELACAGIVSRWLRLILGLQSLQYGSQIGMKNRESRQLEEKAAKPARTLGFLPPISLGASG